MHTQILLQTGTTGSNDSTVHGQCRGFRVRIGSRSLGTGLWIIGSKAPRKTEFYLLTVTLSISPLLRQDDSRAECHIGWLVSRSWIIIIGRQRKTLITRLAVTGRQGLSGHGTEGITHRGYGHVEISICHAAWITAGLVRLCVTVWCRMVWDMHRATGLITGHFRDTRLQRFWKNNCLYLWLFRYGILLWFIWLFLFPWLVFFWKLLCICWLFSPLSSGRCLQ